MTESAAEQMAILPGYIGSLGVKRAGGFLLCDEFKDWMFKYQGGRCGYCGEGLGECWRGSKVAVIEHVECKRKGGIDAPPNLMYACATCNTQKQDNHYTILLDRIAFRRSPAYGVISMSQAKQLEDLGIDLEIPKHESFLFRKEKWVHVVAK